MAKSSALPIVKPEDAGFSKERLERIKPAMQKYIDRKMVPSIVTLIARDGKVVYYDAQGYQDRDKKIPAAKDTIFRLYSNSKALAGLATMILFEDGKLNLDAPVSKYIPAFKDPKVVAAPGQIPTDGRGMPMLFPTVPAKREVTLRDCLRNTTGLATPSLSPYWFIQAYKDLLPETGWDLQESLDKPPAESYLKRAEMYAKLPLNFNPGTDFVYHAGYPVIGAVLEIITGGLLEDFYQERIFKPLGMNDTSFFLDKKKADKLTCCYIPAFEKGKWDIAFYSPAVTCDKARDKKKFCGAGGDIGGLLSTVADYARFGQMLLNGGELDGVRILSRKAVEIMTSSHTKNLNIPMLGAGFGFGMGLGVYTGGSPVPIMRSPGTFGWGGAAGTSFFADPKEKLMAICFTQMFAANMWPGNTYQEDFEKLVYEALL